MDKNSEISGIDTVNKDFKIDVPTMQDGQYKITETDVGVYLSVCPPCNGGIPVKEVAIMQDLTVRRIVPMQPNRIAIIVKEATGQENLIAAPLTIVVPEIQVVVQRDRLGALLDVTTPPGASEVTMFQLLDKLKDANIVYGIDEHALAWIIKAGAGKGVLCASGVPPRDGENAFLKYHVDIESQGRPVELEDGSVDFKNINNFITVTTGQILIERIPATAGIRGIDVFGLPIAAKPGKDIAMPKGKNMVVADQHHLIATIDGQLSIVRNRINVLPTIEVAGDVDYSTGNIDFMGNVIIHGSVQTGFEVKAGGNVEIRGTVYGGMVEATNVIVRRGIKGMNRSVIKARERLVSKFIENATAYAELEVVISDVVLNSSVFAGLKVFVEGQRGVVIGGRISAGEEIRMRTVGNQSHIVTELEVSVNPFLKDELHSLQDENRMIKNLLEEMKLSLAYMRKQGLDNLNAQKRERYDKMQMEYDGLPDRAEEIRQRITDIESLLYSLAPGKVRVSEVMYPGVKVSIGPLVKMINDPFQYLALYSHEGEIKFSSFK